MKVYNALIQAEAAERTMEEQLRAYGAGRRVKLLYTSDEYTKLKSGDEGTVSFVDSMGTVFVDWDCGSNLGLIPGVDRWEVTS